MTGLGKRFAGIHLTAGVSLPSPAILHSRVITLCNRSSAPWQREYDSQPNAAKEEREA